ncbi:MAG: ATP-binding protein [Minwuiales bacterium]|nr:ATP-binding protein [Minwuiales bacterium]
MARQQVSFVGYVVLALVIVAPFLAILLALATTGRLDLEAAAASAFSALVASLLVARWLMTIQATAAAWAGSLAAGQEPPTPRMPGGPVSEQLETSLLRLQRAMAAERADIATESANAARILDRLPDPLLTLDAAGRVGGANKAAEEFWGEGLVGRHLAMAIRHPTLLTTAETVLRGELESAEVEFREAAPLERWLQARIFSVANTGPGGPAAVLALYDLTAVKKAEGMRADFVANVSHELRTPLATLIGFIETLTGPARDDAAARQRFLEIMDSQAQRMARLIEDLLSLSRIEMHEHTAPEGRVEVGPLLDSVATMLQMAAAEKNIRIRVEAAGLAPVVGEADELTEVFQNLVENAIKYSHPDTEVSVVGRRDGDRLAISVVDQGVGIRNNHIPRLTERCYRVDKARSRDLGGTGLGLAIVKHIVSRHRGSLAIESELGVGSRFTVHLPVDPASEAGAAGAGRL